MTPRAWVSAGAGTASVGVVSVTASGWLGLGPLVVGARHNRSYAWYGDAESTSAMLVGALANFDGILVVAAVGPATVREFYNVLYNDPSTTISKAVAYEVSANFTTRFAGGGVALYGNGGLPNKQMGLAVFALVGLLQRRE